MYRVGIFCLFLFLSSISLAEVPEEILGKVNSSDVEERLDACLFLGRFGSPEAVPLLKERLRDPSMLVRHSAANALARIGGEEVSSIFKEMISSQSPEKKRIGLAGLAMTGDPGSIEIVVQQLDNPDWQVRWSAVYALGQWGYRPVLPKLEELAENDPYLDNATGEYPVRKRAGEVCKKIRCSIEWYRNLDDARILAGKLQKPILVYWFVSDNPLCVRMDEIFFSAEISDASQGFVCVKVDAGKEKDLTLQYDINAVPSIIILDKEENIVDRMLGLVSREELLGRLNRILENKGTPKEWKELAAKNSSDVVTSWSLAEWYLDNNRMEDAIPLLENIVRYDPKNNSGYTDNAIFVLGYSYGAMGKYKKAVDMLERLRREYSSFKDMDKALFCLGLDYLSLNKPDHAKVIFTELIELYPESKTIKPAKEVLEKI